MSIVQIISHNECIYKLSEPSEEPQVSKKGATGSKYIPYAALRHEIEKSMKKGTKPYGIMGLPKQPKVSPENYLRKGTGKPPMIPRGKDEIYNKACLPFERLPPVPHTTEVLRETADKLKHVRKNYMAQNVKVVMTMPPKTPERKVVISSDGMTSYLTDGMEPRFLYKEFFGKIPPYLDRIIKFKQRVRERKVDMSGMQQPPCEYITSKEREELLNGLKKNWEELQRTYQGLPILTDTIPKVARKTKLEKQLNQLEKDILLIEKHPFVYVYKDEEDI